MKRFTLMMIFVIMMVIPLTAADKAAQDMETEKTAIKQAALDYLEGWYEGNAERMEKALHPDLVKRVPRPLPSGRAIINSVSAQNMVEYTRAEFGKKRAQHKGETKVEIFDVFNNIATAKTTCGEYIDYLHLVKTNGEWKILNVLWLPNKTMKPTSKEKK